MMRGWTLLLAVAWALPPRPGHAGDKVYRWVDGHGRVHYDDRLPTNAGQMRVRAIPVPIEPSALARLRVEPADGEYLAWADNNLAGPIEVMLRFTTHSNMRGDPALPARATVPAGGSTLVARLRVADPTRDGRRSAVPPGRVLGERHRHGVQRLLA